MYYTNTILYEERSSGAAAPRRSLRGRPRRGPPARAGGLDILVHIYIYIYMYIYIYIHVYIYIY